MQSTTEYEKLGNYINESGFTFDLEKQPRLEEFEAIIGEKMLHVANCVLNTKENFPPRKKKNGELAKKQREYYDPEEEQNMGKKVEYVETNEMWNDNENEWLYCLAYNGRIVKIGMTITSLKERYASYSCGTARAMKKGSCSTTNFIISECNFYAKKSGMSVEIYGIPCPLVKKEISRFGITEMRCFSSVREQEAMLTKCFKTAYSHKPVLCVQEGK